MHLRKAMAGHKKLDKRLMEIKNMLETLSAEELEEVLPDSHKKAVENKKTKPSEWAVFIEKHNIKAVCPVCGSNQYYKHSKGKKDKEKNEYYGKPQYKCLDCGKVYNPLIGTIADNSSLSPTVQIALVYYTLNNHSLAAIRHNLKADYNIDLTQGAILAYRHKILNAILLHYGMPKLSGTVQVDETYFRENQKGVLELINVAPSAIKERKARLKNRKVASELGINGSEFACVVTGIDSKGYVVAVLTGLSKGSSQAFETYFSEYLGEIAFLCSDDYEAYNRYCDYNAIPHYVQPSNMRSTIKSEQKAWTEKHKGKELSEEAIRRKYYGTQGLDRLENYGTLSFTEFERLKKEKHLTLDDIDAFHSQLKRHINKNMTGVATVYLHLYLALYVFKHNWRIANGNAPTSLSDAKAIYVELLRDKSPVFRRADAKNTHILDLVKPSTKYINNLKELTEEMRKKSEEQGFTFDGNDKLLTFDKRKYFRNQNMTTLKRICKDYHIKGYTTTKNKELLAREICRLPEVNEIFLRLVAADSVHAPYVDDLSILLKQAGKVD